MCPEIAKCLETLPDLVLDGELVVLDDQGRAQFEPLRRRALMRNPKNIVRRGAREVERITEPRRIACSGAPSIATSTIG
jgi:hypothetical protein